MMQKAIVLTKEEIGDAIVNFIGVYKEGQIFFPYRVEGTDMKDLPDKVMFHLEMVPKGAKAEDAKHTI